MKADELTNISEASTKECKALLGGAKTGQPIYTPLGEEVQVLFPGLNGGSNWGGASFDPESQWLFVNTMDVGGLFRLVPRPSGSKIAYALRGKGPEFFWDSNRYPCQMPPWGRLYAVDMKTGDIRWQSVLGEFDELTAHGVAKTGAPNIGGSIVTAGGLVFIGATNDRKFRAFDSATGKELWMVRLPASGMATPATFWGKKSKKQFVVIAAGGGNKYDSAVSGKVIAYALP
jgi:glucose dehydrogenase